MIPPIETCSKIVVRSDLVRKRGLSMEKNAVASTRAKKMPFR